MERNQKDYFTLIPAKVRYDNDLSPNAKLLYGEILALCNEKGYCWATNRYWAELYNVTNRAVSKWINELSKKGHIKVLINNVYNGMVENRCIRIYGKIFDKDYIKYGYKKKKEKSKLNDRWWGPMGELKYDPSIPDLDEVF